MSELKEGTFEYYRAFPAKLEKEITSVVDGYPDNQAMQQLSKLLSMKIWSLQRDLDNEQAMRIKLEGRLDTIQHLAEWGE